MPGLAGFGFQIIVIVRIDRADQAAMADHRDAGMFQGSDLAGIVGHELDAGG